MLTKQTALFVFLSDYPRVDPISGLRPASSQLFAMSGAPEKVRRDYDDSMVCRSSMTI
jgi:hypothetical protein